MVGGTQDSGPRTVSTSCLVLREGKPEGEETVGHPWQHTETDAAVTTQQDTENTREKATALERA